MAGYDPISLGLAPGDGLGDSPREAGAKLNAMLFELFGRGAYTDEAARDAVAAMLRAGAGLDLIYDDDSDTITPSVTDPAALRTALLLGALATRSKISGADWNGVDLAVTDGGTGASTAPAARANLGIPDFGAAPGNAPLLGADSKLLASIMPSIAVGQRSSVASQAAMLALVAEIGDVAVRTDFTPPRRFMLVDADPVQLANWQRLLDPTDVVSSFAGLLGDVTAAQAAAALANFFQPAKAGLTSLAAAAQPGRLYYLSAPGTWSPVAIGANLTFAAGTLAAAGGGGSGTGSSGGDQTGTSFTAINSGVVRAQYSDPSQSVEMFTGPDSQSVIQAREGSFGIDFKTGYGQSRFRFFPANAITPAMVIEANSNVGIGTTSPQEKLDVAGNIRSRGAFASYVDGGAGFSSYSASGSFRYGAWQSVSSGTYLDSYSELNFRDNAGTTSWARLNGTRFSVGRVQLQQQPDTPGSLQDGDLWTTPGGLFARINGLTQTFAMLAAANAWKAAQRFDNGVIIESLATFLRNGISSGIIISSPSNPFIFRDGNGLNALYFDDQRRAYFNSSVTCGGNVAPALIDQSDLGDGPFRWRTALIGSGGVNSLGPIMGATATFSALPSTAALPNLVSAADGSLKKSMTAVMPRKTAIATYTGAGTFSAVDAEALVRLDLAADATFTLPANDNVPLDVGTTINVQWIGAGQPTIAAAPGVTIDVPNRRIAARWQTVTLVKVGADAWTIIGPVAA